MKTEHKNLTVASSRGQEMQRHPMHLGGRRCALPPQPPLQLAFFWLASSCSHTLSNQQQTTNNKQQTTINQQPQQQQQQQQQQQASTTQTQKRIALHIDTERPCIWGGGAGRGLLPQPPSCFFIPCNHTPIPIVSAGVITFNYNHGYKLSYNFCEKLQTSYNIMFCFWFWYIFITFYFWLFPMFLVVFGFILALIYSVMSVLMTFVHIRTLAAHGIDADHVADVPAKWTCWNSTGPWQTMMKHAGTAGLNFEKTFFKIIVKIFFFEFSHVILAHNLGYLHGDDPYERTHNGWASLRSFYLLNLSSWARKPVFAVSRRSFSKNSLYEYS